VIRRLVAIAFIFGCTSLAWLILGGTIFKRTYLADSTLRGRVERIWGTSQTQAPPAASYTVEKTRHEDELVDGKRVTKTVAYAETHPVPLAGSDVRVALGLEHRQKGLLWYATYTVDFDATYRFRNDSGAEQAFDVTFPFPSQSALYDNFTFAVQDRRWIDQPAPEAGKALGRVRVPAGETAVVKVGYRSQGLDRWSYAFGKDGVSEVKDFTLTMTTDFRAIDFPEDSIAPTRKERAADGWRLTWQFRNLVTGVNVGMLLPQRLQPGPLAGEISFFAPVSLFFFVVVMLLIAVIRRVEVHPMHFFFLSAAFFAFHLLLAYLVDHVSIHLAFAIASVVSLALVVSYLRTAVGARFAVQAGAAQFVYLVLFSYAFFLKGFTGLAITIGSVLTLFVAMRMTARVDWNEVFRRATAPPRAAGGD
jgi:Inner membrane protein CreD